RRFAPAAVGRTRMGGCDRALHIQQSHNWAGCLPHRLSYRTTTAAGMADVVGQFVGEVRGANVSTQTVYEFNPLMEPRWAEFVRRHPSSSVFHTVSWLEALRRTYGYEPAVYTTSPPDVFLENGLVFCRVTSWITGQRLVSLPFSDHCEPLIRTIADKQVFLSAIERALQRGKLRYFEIRASQNLVDTTCIPRS